MPPQAEVTALAIAESARLTQVAIKKQVAQDVAATWSLLSFDNLTRTWPRWVQEMAALLARFHAQSSDASALAYRATRQLETGVTGPASIADLPSADWVTKALGYAAPGTYSKGLRGGGTPQVAAQRALVATLGTASRIALDGGRTTTLQSGRADRIDVRFYRVTDGDPCYFCALVASRGADYRSSDTAGRNANDRFTGDGLFKFHNECGCTVASAFGKQPALTPVAAEANDIYHSQAAHLPNKERLNAFRQAWETRTRRSSVPVAA